MSDPVTNVEIEDVLSSIRRLVSTEHTDDRQVDGRSETDVDGTTAEAEPPKKSSPKLVLTPAQRVNDAEPSHVNDTDRDDAEEDDTAAEHEAHDVAPDGEGALDETAEGEVEDLSHDTADQPEERQEDALRQMVAEEIAAKVEEEATSHLAAELPEPELDAMDHTASDEAQAHDLEAEDDIADDDGFDEMSAPDVPEFLRRPVTQMNPPEDAEILDETLARAPDTASEPDPSTDPESYTEKLESLEAAVADQADEWEPDGGEEDTLTTDKIEPLPWNDIEAETAEFEEEDPRGGGDEAHHAPWFGEDAVIDEDALRDMVGEIVRQELQGALGERITRNVRKLVRREIHRALMSQGLD